MDKNIFKEPSKNMRFLHTSTRIPNSTRRRIKKKKEKEIDFDAELKNSQPVFSKEVNRKQHWIAEYISERKYTEPQEDAEAKQRRIDAEQKSGGKSIVVDDMGIMKLQMRQGNVKGGIPLALDDSIVSTRNPWPRSIAAIEMTTRFFVFLCNMDRTIHHKNAKIVEVTDQDETVTDHGEDERTKKIKTRLRDRLDKKKRARHTELDSQINKAMRNPDQPESKSASASTESDKKEETAEAAPVWTPQQSDLANPGSFMASLGLLQQLSPPELDEAYPDKKAKDDYMKRIQNSLDMLHRVTFTLGHDSSTTQHWNLDVSVDEFIDSLRTVNAYMLPVLTSLTKQVAGWAVFRRVVSSCNHACQPKAQVLMDRGMTFDQTGQGMSQVRAWLLSDAEIRTGQPVTISYDPLAAWRTVPVPLSTSSFGQELFACHCTLCKNLPKAQGILDEPLGASLSRFESLSKHLERYRYVPAENLKIYDFVEQTSQFFQAVLPGIHQKEMKTGQVDREGDGDHLEYLLYHLGAFTLIALMNAMESVVVPLPLPPPPKPVDKSKLTMMVNLDELAPPNTAPVATNTVVDTEMTNTEMPIPPDGIPILDTEMVIRFKDTPIADTLVTSNTPIAGSTSAVLSSASTSAATASTSVDTSSVSAVSRSTISDTSSASAVSLSTTTNTIAETKETETDDLGKQFDKEAQAARFIFPASEMEFTNDQKTYLKCLDEFLFYFLDHPVTRRRVWNICFPAHDSDKRYGGNLMLEGRNTMVHQLFLILNNVVTNPVLSDRYHKMLHVLPWERYRDLIAVEPNVYKEVEGQNMSYRIHALLFKGWSNDGKMSVPLNAIQLQLFEEFPMYWFMIDKQHHEGLGPFLFSSSHWNWYMTQTLTDGIETMLEQLRVSSPTSLDESVSNSAVSAATDLNKTDTADSKPLFSPKKPKGKKK